jgi:acyl carrier protein
LIGFIEERFEVKIEPEEVNLENFETLSAIDRLVRHKLAG